MTTANILDPIHPELSPLVFDNSADPEPRVKDVHRKWIMRMVYSTLEDAGYEGMEKWLSLVFTGSLTTYQYSDESDVDISLFVDVDNFPEWSRAEMIGVMIDKVDGVRLPGTPYPMQCFVVPPEVTRDDLYKPGMRSGYDLDNEAWIVPPERERVRDVQAEMSASYVHALQQADKMANLLKYEPDRAIMFWHQIKRRRRRDMKAGKGDYSDSNITYKMLANRGLFPQIAEVSGEYIAKTGMDWQKYYDMVEQEAEDAPMGEQPWRSGVCGKCFMDDAGRVYSWTTDAPEDNPSVGVPHHTWMAQNVFNMTSMKGSGWIYPDGRIHFPYLDSEPTSEDDLEDIVASIPGARRWEPDESESEWGWSSKTAADLDIAALALQSTHTGGGITIRVDGTVPATGYAFSPFKGLEQIIPVAALKEEDIDAFLDKNKQHLTKSENYLGIWVNGLNAYVDVTQVIEDFDLAYKLAWDADQLAMWDVAQGEEIPVREGGSTPPEIASNFGHGASQFAVKMGAPRSMKQVAKFVYSPLTNHLVIGAMAREEGEVESHADLLRRGGLPPQNNVYGQFDQSGRVQTFGRPKIDGYGKAAMSPYEADWRAKQALEQTIPGVRFDTNVTPTHDRWVIDGPPKVTYMREPPVVGGEPSSEPDEWTFAKVANVITPDHALPWTPGRPGKGVVVGNKVWAWSDARDLAEENIWHHDDVLDALEEQGAFGPGDMVRAMFFIDLNGEIEPGYDMDHPGQLTPEQIAALDPRFKVRKGKGSWTFSKVAGTWAVDPRAVDKAATHLGLQHPVEVRVEGGTYGQYQGLQNGTHIIKAVGWLRPQTANEQIWHELVHAKQAENGVEFPDRPEDYDAYRAQPHEQEAHDFEAPFPVVLPRGDSNVSDTSRAVPT